MWIAIATLYIFLFIFAYMMEHFFKYFCQNNKSMLKLSISWGIISISQQANKKYLFFGLLSNLFHFFRVVCNSFMLED